MTDADENQASDPTPRPRSEALVAAEAEATAAYDHARTNGDASALDSALQSLIRRSGRALVVFLVGQGIIIVILSIAVSFLVYRSLGESHRVAVAVGEQVSQLRAQARIISAQQQRIGALVGRIEKETRATCAFNADIARAPVTPGTTATGAKILIDARVAFDRAGCPGQLPPPSHILTALAAKYHLTIPPPAR
jgi:hypothetical protein